MLAQELQPASASSHDRELVGYRLPEMLKIVAAARKNFPLADTEGRIIGEAASNVTDDTESPGLMLQPAHFSWCAGLTGWTTKSHFLGRVEAFSEGLVGSALDSGLGCAQLLLEATKERFPEKLLHGR